MIEATKGPLNESVHRCSDKTPSTAVPRTAILETWILTFPAVRALPLALANKNLDT